MSTSHEFQGTIEIDGRVEHDRVFVCFSSHMSGVQILGTAAGGQSKKTLMLQPFDSFMLRAANSVVMKTGFFYSIAGTDVGAYVDGPLGHPGDGEFDHRPIKRFDVRSR